MISMRSACLFVSSIGVVSFLFALLAAWAGAHSAAWWSFPVFLFGFFLSLGFGLLTVIVVIGGFLLIRDGEL